MINARIFPKPIADLMFLPHDFQIFNAVESKWKIEVKFEYTIDKLFYNVHINIHKINRTVHMLKKFCFHKIASI